MNIVSPTSIKYESEWISQSTLWKELGNDAFKNCYDQINRRVAYANKCKVHERGEETLNNLIRSKLVKGLTAEWIVYYIFNKMGYELNPPRDDGASWDPDLYSRNTLETFEVKCTEGELRPNWRNEIKGLQGWNLQRYYRQNSPSYAFQMGDRHGNVSQRNTDPIFKSFSHSQAYLVLVRKRKVYNWKNNRKLHVDDEYKISAIVKKNDLTLNLNKYFEEYDWNVINKSKRRLIETNLKGITFYGPKAACIHQFEFDEKEFPCLL